MSRDFSVRINKNILMPVVKPRGRSGKTEPVYPWRKMEVGDSFLFPERVGRGGQSAACSATKALGKRFVVYKTDEGYRCWRAE